MKTADSKASQIRFGIELETVIPAESNIPVGAYHAGRPVTAGRTVEGRRSRAPKFREAPWRAERDGSIRFSDGEKPCEFVSPILQGAEGVEALCRFVEWMNAVGAKVNDSCGCHVTVGVESVIGSRDPQAMGEFARKLAHIAKWHARAIYGQTGAGRHLNRYSHTFEDNVARLARRMERQPDPRQKAAAAAGCGRGMVNFRKLFSDGVVEFRAFAGTTSLSKIEHHLATVLGLCRRAHEVQCLGAFKKNKLQSARTGTAADALQFLWHYLGWSGGSRPVAMGLFGRLHEDFPAYSGEAMRLCRQFDERYPDTVL